MLATTGMRKGEALALDWSDIDYERKQISITKTLAYGLGGKYGVQTPKTKAGVRTVPLTDRLEKVLKEYRSDLCPHLFHTVDGDYLRLSKPAQWLQMVYKHDPDLRQIRIHGFRHTFASLLIAADPSINRPMSRHCLATNRSTSLWRFIPTLPKKAGGMLKEF